MRGCNWGCLAVMAWCLAIDGFALWAACSLARWIMGG